MGWGRASLVAVLLMTSGAWAQAPSDVVWPTYDQVERPADTGLGCAALRAELTHVTADISLLNKAKFRVEEILHSAFDLERYASTHGAGGQRVGIGAINSKEIYPVAREQIVASLKVAQARRDHLKSLEPACKPEPQPVSAP